MENEKFQDRLKALRAERGFTQKELAERAGISLRSVQNYELGCRMPVNMGAVQSLAGALSVTASELLGEEDRLVAEAAEKGGNRAARDVHGLISEVSGLFAGGELDDAEKDAVMEALAAAYWDSKKKNRKYAPAKYRGKSGPQE
jgi:transcriptional regulator with XRE-family HTH domain